MIAVVGMDWAAKYVLETERLRLEPYQPKHLGQLFEMDSNPDVMRFIGNGKPRSLEETRAAITSVGARWATLGHGWWAMVERESGLIVGSVCAQNLAHVEAAPLEIGWRLRPAFRGKGFATEGALAAIDFAFRRVDVDHVLAVANPENAASIRVMVRLGMQSLGLQTHYAQPCATYRLDRP